MKSIKAKKDFTIGNDFYARNDVIANIKDFELIISLNEKGFIEPLNRKEIEEIREYLKNPKKFENKEEE